MNSETGGEPVGRRRLNVTTALLVAALVVWLAACGTDSSPDPASTTGEASASDPDEPNEAGEPDEGAELEEGACFDQGKPFKGEALLYIEHNATDQDTGVHGTFDQEGLAAACLEKPDGTQIMAIDPTNELGALGINQFFFESREPPADEYSISDLKADFPEGEYSISGTDYNGVQRVGAAMLTHAIPAPPEITAPKLVEEEKADQNALGRGGLTVRWKAVSETIDGKPVEVAGYEVIVTDADGGDPNNLSQPEYDVHVPPDVTELAVPEGFLLSGTLYEVEVLALEESGNQTISLGFFTTK